MLSNSDFFFFWKNHLNATRILFKIILRPHLMYQQSVGVGAVVTGK